MANCKACSKEIIWMKTENNRSHPFDARQTLLLVNNPDGTKTMKQGHVSHFATCPNAAQFSHKPATEKENG